MKDNALITRLKNPYFIVGIVGVILTSLQVEASSLTTWASVAQLILDTIKNPYLLCTTTMAIVGVFVEPTSKGISDRKDV